MYLTVSFKDLGRAVRLLSFTCLLGWCLLPALASAQGVLRQAQTGTIQLRAEDDGYILISGNRYRYDDEVTEVYWQDERVSSSILDVGVVVRYTLQNGTLARIEVLGPAERIRDMLET